jgi:DNA gyrase subunit A
VARVVDGGKGSPVSVISSVATTLRSRVGVIRADGTMVAIEASELAEVASRGKGAFTPLAAFASQGRIVGVVALDREIAMGTRFGVVKRLASDATPTEAQFNRAGKDGVAVIQLAEGDELAGAVNADDTAELVFVSAQAQLLRFPANSVRAQGRSSSGMAGMKLAEGDEVLVFCAPTTDAAVVTSTDAGNVKWTPLAEYPPKGRSTMGVRCHSFKKGDSALGSVVVAARIVGAPSQPSKRDASGVPGDTPYATV